MKYLLLILVFLFSTFIEAQNASIRGEIQTESKEKIDMCTILLLSMKDSTVVCWDTFFSKDFEFKGLNPDSYILRIQDVQYQTLDTVVRINNGENFIREPIILKGRFLSEVVVSAKRPVMYRKNGNIVLDVRNSYLKDESRISNLLEKTPGIEVDASGSISMFGKESLLIFINDKQATSQEQLKALQPSDIDRIEVIRNVGAEYSASTDGIIKIWTKKNIEENYRIIINNNTSYGRKWSNDINVSTFINIDKVSQYLSYQNDISNGRQFDLNDTYTFLTDYSSINQREITIDNRFRNHSILYSLEYDINKKNKLGLQYSGLINKWVSNHSGIQIIKNKDVEKEKREIKNEDINKKNLHNISLNYKYLWDDKNSFSLISDYATSVVKIGNDINERSANSDNFVHQYNQSTGDYNIFSIQPELQFLNKKNEVTIGAKYSTMNNRSEIYYSSTNTLSDLKLKEHIGALYATLKGNIGDCNYSIGLRGEYAQTKIDTGDSQNEVNRDYWDLFPYVMIGKNLTEKINASFYYRRRIQRPSFSALNPTFLYRDSLSYSTGNPYLKPMNSDMFALFIDGSKISFSIGYYIYNNSIFMEDIQDTTNPSIAISTYGNMKKKNELLNASVSYSYNYSKLSGVVAFDVNKPFMEIPYLDSYKKMNRAIYLLKLSANLQLLENTSINGSFTLRSKGDSKNIEWDSYNRLNLSINQHVLNKKLFMSLSVNDIFNMNKTNHWTSYSNKIRYMMNSDSDSRYITLSLKYNWGISKKNIQKKSSNTESINRM
ncbi:MAG: outer membrane beta-barrel protein [Prevotella sp.]|jgi:hypothetical protein|nr:outer membrane beta-barrel protein [Prevotella sp.]